MDEVQKVEASALHGRPLRYFDMVMVAFVVILLLSNVLGAGKVSEITLPYVGLWPFGAGILFFPISYVIGDVLTEVYGFARARRCIWVGTAALLFMAFMSWVVVALPPAADWTRAGGLRAGVRAGAADRDGLDRRLLGGGIRQFDRAGADEGVDRRAAFVDADHRQHGRRSGCGQPDLLSARLLGSGGMDE